MIKIRTIEVYYMKCDKCEKESDEEKFLIDLNLTLTIEGWDNDFAGLSICPDCQEKEF
ncbi:MAG: hypothetical protein GY870_22005 [archaeon]|nr:hypothetical protein [archaeon]